MCVSRERDREREREREREYKLVVIHTHTHIHTTHTQDKLAVSEMLLVVALKYIDKVPLFLLRIVLLFQWLLGGCPRLVVSFKIEKARSHLQYKIVDPPKKKKRRW